MARTSTDEYIFCVDHMYIYNLAAGCRSIRLYGHTVANVEWNIRFSKLHPSARVVSKATKIS